MTDDKMDRVRRAAFRILTIGKELEILAAELASDGQTAPQKQKKSAYTHGKVVKREGLKW